MVIQVIPTDFSFWIKPEMLTVSIISLLHFNNFLLIIIFILIIIFYYFFQLSRWDNSLFFVQDNNNKVNSFNSVILEKTENKLLNYNNLVLWYHWTKMQYFSHIIYSTCHNLCSNNNRYNQRTNAMFFEEMLSSNLSLGKKRKINHCN